LKYVGKYEHIVSANNPDDKNESMMLNTGIDVSSAHQGVLFDAI
jgi:hypothetical protein